VDGDTLAGLLRGTTARLAFLDAPEAANHDAFGSVAAAVVQAGLPAAIAHQHPLPASSAIAFAAGFYRSLAAGHPADAAVAEGRRAILSALGTGWRDRVDWAAPVLYTNAPDGRLLNLEGREEAPGAAQQSAAPVIHQHVFAGDVAVPIGTISGGQVQIDLRSLPSAAEPAAAAPPPAPPPAAVDAPPVHIDPDDPPLAAIRQLLLDAFTPQTLRRFCQDRPTFRPILDAFGPGHGFNDMVDRVIDHCQTQLLFDPLLAGVREANPGQYARFAQALGLAPFPQRDDTVVLPADSRLPALLVELRQVVRDHSPDSERAQALEQVAALSEAVTAQQLDLDAMEAVLRWFESELPSRSGEVLSVILNARSRAEQAGDELLLDFARRFEEFP
jgi:hypothetical protein